MACYFKRHPWSGLAVGTVLLVVCMAASLLSGLSSIGLTDLYHALSDRSADMPAHIIVRTVRAPRTLIATGVGASLGVAGALMQALTGNPLASPGILGINAGGALFVVLALFLFKSSSLASYTWFAFAGAAAAGAVVYGIGSAGRSGMTPLKLTVAGAAMTALLASMTQGILVLNERTLDEIRFWLAGSVAARDTSLFLQVLPYMASGLLLAFVLGKAVTTLSLGDDVARGLGQRTGLTKLAVAVTIVLLAGSSVAVAGPIAFIGLAVPHIARGLAGPDYRWVLPYSALLGAVLLLAADIGSRIVIRPEEIPVGVMTALVGAPFFIYLARWGGKRA